MNWPISWQNVKDHIDDVEDGINPELLPKGGFGYEETTTTTAPLLIEWDGNTDGRVSMNYFGLQFYKVSDFVPTNDDLKTAVAVMVQPDGTETVIEFASVWDDVVAAGNATDEFVFLETSFVSRKEGEIAPGLSVPETGVYFLCAGAVYNKSLSIPNVMVEVEQTVIKTIDPKYIKDMYHETKEVVEILPECRLEFNPDIGYPIPQVIEGVEVGKTYIVNFNGTEYECVAKEHSFENDSGEMLSSTVLGNLGVIVDNLLYDTGEPFLIETMPADMAEMLGGINAVCMVENYFDDLTLSIRGEQTTITPLPAKYLPDTVATKADIFGAMEASY